MTDPEVNKRTAIAFLELALVQGNPDAAIERYVGQSYRQHSPNVADGTEAFAAFASQLHREHPDLELRFHRVLADGDLVALHAEVGGMGEDRLAAVDLYRFDGDGRIVEHWEVIQPVPETAANHNGMF